ncbi:MAG: rhamnose ABC transporter substrate-binding protein [Phycisphaerae bacterium]|nr:Autoinducer 2-binding protein LsrB [Phycisphaerales bacterium]MCK6475441.1 substrate-binding domain-containing protein [Phycisphaerales bacterium]
MKILTQVLITAIMATVMAFTATAVATGAVEPSPSKRITICLLPKKKGLPYFTTCSKGAQQAADELGDVELIYDGPTDGSPEKAASMVDRWALRGVDVIAVSPNDPEVLGQAMKKAREKGIRVITWDADAAPATREFMVNQATAREIGHALVDAMAKDLGSDQPEGKVAIITATLTAANQNEWIKYMKERLEKYPKLTLIATKPSNEDQRLAFQIAQDLMKAHPDLKGIFGISSVAFPGAAEAVKQAGNSGKVLVTGLATPNDMKAYVKDGTVKSVVLWNTVDLGYLTVHAAHALATGTLKPGQTSFTAGRLGERKIEGDQILLGQILVFTKDNIDQFDF